jgi:two-component system chemotaxis sensor kinase CheA
MKTRMQPIGTVWNKFPRVARELAIQCGKRVNVDLQGSETELDKTVLEAISEPLTHIIRNAVDHGIESPEVRAKRGKPVEGNVRLSSGHKGGHVFIEISDDGAGINVERVKRKAVEKGLITEARALQLTTVQAYQLLFAPGLSTAEKVTNISGRGVGMDVVRSKIERIGGSIEISSEPGRGSTFRVRLPLTLAIVPAIIVSCLGQRFAIPQQGLQELLRIGPNAEGVEYIQGAPVLRLRGRLLPLAWLSDLLGNEDSHCGSHHVIVLRSGETTFGLVVDEVANSEEIVVKPLASCLSGVNVYAGCTILGDGQVALILETTNLIARARKSESHAAATTAEDSFTVAAVSARQRFVLCEVGRARVAIPLDQVERLEKLHQGSLESRSGRAVIQYRGHVISVIRFEDGSDQFHDVESMADDSSRLHVLMHRSRGQQIAVVVSRIIDVVEQEVSEAQGRSTLIALGRVTELSDLRHLAPQSLGQPGNDVDNPVAEVA